MKTHYLLKIIFLSLSLMSCATPIQPQNTRPAGCPAHLVKNPTRVAFFNKESIKHPYNVLGKESISKYNLGGNKRQEAHIRDAMRELAAAMGGDAVIDIKHDEKSITGTVIAFQKEKESEKG